MNATDRKINNLDKFLFLDLSTETDTVSLGFKFSHWSSVMFFMSGKPIYFLISAACLEHQTIISAWSNPVSAPWAHWQLDIFQGLCFYNQSSLWKLCWFLFYYILQIFLLQWFKPHTSRWRKVTEKNDCSRMGRNLRNRYEKLRENKKEKQFNYIGWKKRRKMLI